MKIELNNVGKRFNADWIFRKLTCLFQPGKHYAITGPNGSGKSTLLQIISGAATHNEGTLNYFFNGKSVPSEKIFLQSALAAPYLELIEEMTLLEFLSFHHHMKGWLPSVDSKSIIEILGLGRSAGKEIRYYSSGMKQRVKLAQAIFSNVPAVLLDEPLTNLDEAGVQLYLSLIKNYCANRLVIISSNDPKEYNFCHHIINIGNYK
jgi:ABC-2 type transport system ATP-binding protein